MLNLHRRRLREPVVALLRSFPVPPLGRRLPMSRVPAVWTQHPTPGETALVFPAAVLVAALPGWSKLSMAIVVLECWVLGRGWIAPSISMRRAHKWRSMGTKASVRLERDQAVALTMRQRGVSMAELLVDVAMLATVALTGELFWLVGRRAVAVAQSVLEPAPQTLVAVLVVVSLMAAALYVAVTELALWWIAWTRVRRWVYARVVRTIGFRIAGRPGVFVVDPEGGWVNIPDPPHPRDGETE